MFYITSPNEPGSFVLGSREFIRSRAVLVAQDRDGDERAQLFLVEIDKSGVMRPLTEPTPPYFLRGGRLHPNGRWLVYGALMLFMPGIDN